MVSDYEISHFTVITDIWKGTAEKVYLKTTSRKLAGTVQAGDMDVHEKESHSRTCVANGVHTDNWLR